MPLHVADDGEHQKHGIQHRRERELPVDEQTNVDHVYGDPEQPVLEEFARHHVLCHETDRYERRIEPWERGAR